MKTSKWFVLGGIVLFVLLAYVFIPPFYQPSRTVDVPVYSKSSAREIGVKLKELGVVHFAFPFRVLTKVTRVDRKLKAGLYRFNLPMSLWSLAETLSQGKSELLALKVPEGFTANQVAQELESMKVVPADQFLQAGKDPALLKELEIPGPSPEGFLFPETYRVPLGAGPNDLVALMVRQFYAVVGNDFKKRCEARNMTPYQIITLASIIEKEAQRKEERPVIAGVIYNRLGLKMRLEVNATLEYVLNTKKAWLTNDQLNTNSPYNTYRHRGLPPTPICNPGSASIEAALEPAPVNYLYYVAQGDGSHLFAQTFEEHQKNVRLAKKIRRAKRLQNPAP